uniref:Uncharacterized protein n=1 Tax=Kalanchoe fedtschenkoi TaxID=63787 RepID=A0A7N0TFI7_KALFE
MTLLEYCVGMAIVMYGSPLAAMHHVVTKRSVEFLPFLTSSSLFANGGVWDIYALLAGDFFVLIPNGTGFFLGAAQLTLNMIYRMPPPPQDAKEEAPRCELLLAASIDPEHQG